MLEPDADLDGYAPQSGAMFSPQQTKLVPGPWFRFFGTIDRNRFGADSAMAGGGWIDYENCLKVSDFAARSDISIAKAARQLLAIPGEWHDCGYLGKAALKVTVKAWAGRGKPAAAMSPDSALRRSPVTMPPAGGEMKQYFVPGERALPGALFEVRWTRPVIHKASPVDLLA